MGKLISKIKAWIHSKRIIHKDIIFSPIVSTVQEDIRDIETKKRVAKAFEQQSEQIKIRARKQHSCSDPLSCKRRTCFKSVPDKIVSEKIMSKEEVDRELGR